MKSKYQAVLTENSIVVLFKGSFQTSIPLRHWSTHDGTTWSSRLRQGHQIEWLIGRLNEALNDPSTESTMQLVHRVLADPSMPPRLPTRPKSTVGEALPTGNGSSIATLVAPMPSSPHRRKRQRGIPQSPRSAVRVRRNVSV
jgi:hypothetical protein